MMGKKRLASIMLVVTLVVAFFSNAMILGPFVMFSRADPGNISEEWDNSTTLNVTVLQDEPRVNWFDFQYNNSGTWVSRLNQQIDVNETAEYRFIVNVSSDQGWSDINYIWVTAWADLGDESSEYNESLSLGGNKNLNITYTNTSGADWKMNWPDDEATINLEDCTETEETDPDGSPGNTECYNVTFAFTPSYQLRYAPGNGGAGARDDAWSWNFNITAVDQGWNYSYDNPTAGESEGEFGIFTYTEIVSVDWPEISGSPGTTVTVDDTGGSGNVTLVARSNGNYSLAVDLDQLDHATKPGANIANTTVSIRGGDVSSPLQFLGTGPRHLFGGVGSYRWAQNDTTSFTTNNIEYRIAIPLSQTPGNYSGTIRYLLTTEE